MFAINLLLALVAVASVVCIEAYYILNLRHYRDPLMVNIIATFINASFLAVTTFCLIPEVELNQLPHVLKADGYSLYGFLLELVYVVPLFVFNLTVNRLLTRR